MLAMQFLRRFAKDNERAVARFSDDALHAMMRHSWPGNVRELENTIERAVVLATRDAIHAEDLEPASVVELDEGLGLLVPGITMAEVERIVIERTLEAVGGSTSEAAKMLGISRRKIQYRLREWTGDESVESDA